MNSRTLKKGTILNGKYIIESVIGEGGFGITYKATDLTLNETVAIKEYFPSTLATRDTTTGKSDEITVITGEGESAFKKGVKKFEDEAANLAKFRKEPGIVGVKTFFHENNTGYMVMEYIEGITLKEYLEKKGGKVASEECKKIMGRILTSLSIVNKAGIIHRDISPDNIMITSDGQGKLIDFGAARFVGNEDEKSLTVILKEGYAPPEQYHSDGKQGPWTDIYAICATMYRMVSGTRPQEASGRMMNGDEVVPLSKYAGADPVFSRTIEKGMSIEAGKRYQTVEKLVSAFDGKQSPVKYFIIAGGALAAMLLAGLIVLVVNLVGAKKNVTEGGAIIKKQIDNSGEETNVTDITSENDETSHNIIDDGDFQKKLENDLEMITGRNIFLDYYMDFDGDGDKELYALIDQTDDAYFINSGYEVWFCDNVMISEMNSFSESYWNDSEGIYKTVTIEDATIEEGRLENSYKLTVQTSDGNTYSYGVVDKKPIYFSNEEEYWEWYDSNEFAAKTPKTELSYSELYSLITEASNTEDLLVNYDDFDGDGIREMLGVSVVPSEIHSGYRTIFWSADSEGAYEIMTEEYVEIPIQAVYHQTETYYHGFECSEFVGRMGKEKNWFFNRVIGGTGDFCISIGYENGKGYGYFGDGKFSESENGSQIYSLCGSDTTLNNLSHSAWPRDWCGIYRLNGNYVELAASQIPKEILFSFEDFQLINEEIEYAIDRGEMYWDSSKEDWFGVGQFYLNYENNSYHYIDSVFYSSDGCFYINYLFFNKEIEYDSVYGNRNGIGADENFTPDDWGGDDSGMISFRNPFYCYAKVYVTSDNKLEFDGVFHSYRAETATEFTPYYPNMRIILNQNNE